MTRGKLLYEGKAKQIYVNDNNVDSYIMSYKDDATAFDGKKKGQIENKGAINNRIAYQLFKLLEKNHIKTHLIEQIDEQSALVKKVTMIPIEVVVRNIVAGSLAKRLGLEEGTPLKETIIELYYKDDALNDPMVNEYHIKAMSWANLKDIALMQEQALKINQILQKFFKDISIILVDFKLEFGLYAEDIILADEISPDTCRLWDKDSLEKLDKDRFRRDMGKEQQAYQEVAKRIEAALA